MLTLEHATDPEIHTEIRRLRYLQTWHIEHDFELGASMAGQKIDELLDLLLTRALLATYEMWG